MDVSKPPGGDRYGLRLEMDLSADFAALAGDALLDPLAHVFVEAGPDKTVSDLAVGGPGTHVGDAMQGVENQGVEGACGDVTKERGVGGVAGQCV